MSGIGSPATGPRFGTVTSKLVCAERPSESFAVTVTVADPCAAASTLTTAPETDTDATPASEVDAAKASASPSGSLKCSEASTSAAFPTKTSMSGIGSPAAGARFGTVTSNVCVAANPPGSVAVTATSVVPLARAVTVTALPATDTVAAAGLDEVAE